MRFFIQNMNAKTLLIFSAHNRQFGKMASDVHRMKCFRIFTFVASLIVGAKPLPLRQAETVVCKFT